MSQVLYQQWYRLNEREKEDAVLRAMASLGWRTARDIALFTHGVSRGTTVMHVLHRLYKRCDIHVQRRTWGLEYCLAEHAAPDAGDEKP